MVALRSLGHRVTPMAPLNRHRRVASLAVTSRLLGRTTFHLDCAAQAGTHPTKPTDVAHPSAPGSRERAGVLGSLYLDVVRVLAFAWGVEPRSIRCERIALPLSYNGLRFPSGRALTVVP